jgi:hypothetical protein
VAVRGGDRDLEGDDTFTQLQHAMSGRNDPPPTRHLVRRRLSALIVVRAQYVVVFVLLTPWAAGPCRQGRVKTQVALFFCWRCFVFAVEHTRLNVFLPSSSYILARCKLVFFILLILDTPHLGAKHSLRSLKISHQELNVHISSRNDTFVDF